MKLTRLDGGMGTLLQARGLSAGESPENWNLDHPDEIAAIHAAYVAAGSEIVYTNTFGANRLKYHGPHSLEEVIRAAVSLARKSGARVALDIGPTGRLLKPAGDIEFSAAYAAFAETVRIGVEAGADLIAIETMSDLKELKAAVLAAKEGSSLPIYATVALGEDGKLLTGADVETVAALLEALGVDAYGFNCGLGPDRMLPWVERLAQASTKPIIVKPNAGLPELLNGRTVFRVAPEEFASHLEKLVQAGATIVGGCCGTTPEHLSAIKCEVPSITRKSLARTIVSSGTSVVEIRPYEGLVIGERINPTGKKALKEAYRTGDTAYILREAVAQIDAGAKILDVNCGVPGLDEAALLDETVLRVQSVVTAPIEIDTADPVALERALRHVNGKPLVNSVNGTRASMDAVFPLVRRFGGTLVALCLDEQGIPPTAEGRIEIARRILAEGARFGFRKEDFLFDALTLAVSADGSAALVTLETVERLVKELGVNTVLGVSNVSFGLPNRPALNNTMYALAKRRGLSAAIANPAAIRDEIDSAAEAVLLGRDKNCARWIEHCEAMTRSTEKPVSAASPSVEMGLVDAIRHGLAEDARRAAAAMCAAGESALAVIERGVVPALEEVGRGFEEGRVFLPQLLMAADAAGAAFEVVKRNLPTGGGLKAKRPIVLATVKGDIHDIGKNIVRALLENYGFAVIDLGRDVPPERICEVAEESNAMLVGLSALMTTTVGAMAETVKLIREKGLSAKICVGGAVVTQDYADQIGADFYAKDAMKTVRIAEKCAII